jgi:CDP-paratose 2-epimerase
LWWKDEVNQVDAEQMAAELTRACVARAGRVVKVEAEPATREADIPYYLTDNTAVTDATGWRPTRTVDAILDDVFYWLTDHRQQLEPILAQ